MPRPFKCRRISGNARVDYFKPKGIPLCDLEEVCLGVDELEAIKLADLQELYQTDAAENMKVSRQTFGNIINSAHRKIADALVNGKALRIEGGPIIQMPDDANSGNMNDEGFGHHGGRCRNRYGRHGQNE